MNLYEVLDILDASREAGRKPYVNPSDYIRDTTAIVRDNVVITNSKRNEDITVDFTMVIVKIKSKLYTIIHKECFKDDIKITNEEQLSREEYMELLRYLLKLSDFDLRAVKYNDIDPLKIKFNTNERDRQHIKFYKDHNLFQNPIAHRYNPYEDVMILPVFESDVMATVDLETEGIMSFDYSSVTIEKSVSLESILQDIKECDWMYKSRIGGEKYSPERAFNYLNHITKRGDFPQVDTIKDILFQEVMDKYGGKEYTSVYKSMKEN